jgi:hypothetical protein
MLVDQIYFDMNVTSIGGVLSIKNLDEKKLAWSSLMTEKLPHQLKLVQNCLENNPSKSGFLVRFIFLNGLWHDLLCWHQNQEFRKKRQFLVKFPFFIVCAIRNVSI